MNIDGMSVKCSVKCGMAVTVSHIDFSHNDHSCGTKAYAHSHNMYTNNPSPSAASESHTLSLTYSLSVQTLTFRRSVAATKYTVKFVTNG